MIGGNNYRKSEFNLAVQGERQPGSSFKPFVLATALKDGISPDSEFESGPVQIPLGDKLWYVHNYENSDLGRISLTTATEVSDNTVYAQLTQLVGPGAIVRTAKKLGISSPLKNYFRDRPRRRGGQPASRWRAPSPPSTTAGYGSTVPPSATIRERSPDVRN